MAAKVADTTMNFDLQCGRASNAAEQFKGLGTRASQYLEPLFQIARVTNLDQPANGRQYEIDRAIFSGPSRFSITGSPAPSAPQFVHKMLAMRFKVEPLSRLSMVSVNCDRAVRKLLFYRMNGGGKGRRLSGHLGIV